MVGIKVTFSAHAKMRMALRSVTEEDIIAALETPGRTEGRAFGRTAVFKTVGKRTLEIITEMSGDHVRIITVKVLKR